LRAGAMRLLLGARRRRRDPRLRDARRGELTTLEGLAALYAQQKGLAQAPALHPLQQPFIDDQPPPSRHCYKGMMITAAELRAENPRPTEAQIRTQMNAPLCRWGTYPGVMKAIKLASTKRAEAAR